MNTQRLNILLLGVTLLLTACEQNSSVNDTEQTTPETASTAQQQPAVQESAYQPGDPLSEISSASDSSEPTTSNKVKTIFAKIRWEELVPADYRPEKILHKYQQQLSDLEDSDPKALKIYDQMQKEFENAPVNEALDGKPVKLAGFVAPLEAIDGKISEFLLVPYFGACIHVPPPPINQTVLVKTAEGSELPAADALFPVWASGIMKTSSQSTDMGDAGYVISQATLEKY